MVPGKSGSDKEYLDIAEKVAREALAQWEGGEDCSHNAMVANDDPQHAWKCADCGHVYGKEAENQ